MDERLGQPGTKRESLNEPTIGTSPTMDKPGAKPVRELLIRLELRPIIAAWLDRFSSSEDALAALGAARIPCARVLWPAEVVAAPHLQARRAFPSVVHPTHGPVRVTASPRW